MSKKKFDVPRFEGEHLVVKNKRFKKSDLLAFFICLVAALVIWMYATHSELIKEQALEDKLENIQSEQISSNDGAAKS